MLIQAFEWTKLKIGENGFFKSHYKKVVEWHIKQDKKYFEIGSDFIRFTNWVGVLQVGNLTIEILPKLGSAPIISDDIEREEHILKWKRAFVEMLGHTGWIKFRNTNTFASLSLHNFSILDIYYMEFIKEVETVVRNGLNKRYSKKEQNRNCLKGKLLFNKNISLNLIHKERFFTRADNYDENHKLNQVIAAALRVIISNVSGGIIKAKAENLLILFDEIERKSFNQLALQKITLDRKTSHYKYSFELSKLILLNLNPSSSTGQAEVISLFFDMNELWEAWLLFALKNNYKGSSDTKVLGKKVKPFWRSTNTSHLKQLEIDILVEHKGELIVLDAKWKTPELLPSDNDIKQMFAYNHLWNSTKAWLCYPQPNKSEAIYGQFQTSDNSFLGTWYYDVFDDRGVLKKYLELPTVDD